MRKGIETLPVSETSLFAFVTANAKIDAEADIDVGGMGLVLQSKILGLIKFGADEAIVGSMLDHAFIMQAPSYS